MLGPLEGENVNTGFSIGLICQVVLKKEMQKVFTETFRSKNYSTLPLHTVGCAMNLKVVIFKHSLKKLYLLPWNLTKIFRCKPFQFRHRFFGFFSCSVTVRQGTIPF
jgi:hypothetical protein